VLTTLVVHVLYTGELFLVIALGGRRTMLAILRTQQLCNCELAKA
jgi:hypothetical protein